MIFPPHKFVRNFYELYITEYKYARPNIDEHELFNNNTLINLLVTANAYK